MQDVGDVASQVTGALDEKGAKTVYARCPRQDGVSLAVYNRLIRAAGYRVVTL